MSEPLSVRLKSTEAEKAGVLEELHLNSEPRVDVEHAIRETMTGYKAFVATMENALQTDTERARESLRQLLGRITLTEDETGAIWAEFENETARPPFGDGLPPNVVARARNCGWRRVRIC